MRTREELEPSFTGQKGRNENASAGSASRLRYDSLRSPSLRREAEHLPQSVTHAVRRMCYLSADNIPTVALPFSTAWIRLRAFSAFFLCGCATLR